MTEANGNSAERRRAIRTEIRSAREALGIFADEFCWQYNVTPEHYRLFEDGGDLTHSVIVAMCLDLGIEPMFEL